NHKTSLILGS
ncbi:hypothetical protein FOXB_14179, partial [Fusarium oxysporum f. sp. conglutinans Fo5176]